MNNPGQTHWDGCATEGGPAHYECAVREVERLRALIETAGRPWLHLDVTPPIPWEGGIDGAMEAACREITRLRDFTTPQPIEDLPYAIDTATGEKWTERALLFHPSWPHPVVGLCSGGVWVGTEENGTCWMLSTEPTHWLPLPEAPK